MRYAPRVTDTTRMVAEINYSGLHFLHGCCSDDNASLATGPAFKFGDVEISPQAYYRYRLYDGKAYSSEEGVRLETGYSKPFYSLGLGVEAGKAQLIGIQVAGTAARGYLSADISGTRSVTFGTTVRYERDSYPVPSQAFSAPSVEFRSSFLGLWNLPTNTWVAALYRKYDGPTLTSSGVRIDRYLSLGASVELDFVNIWGMSPSVGLAYETQASNDQLGQFNRVRFLLGVGKVF